MIYLPRVVDSEIDDLLGSAGAVLIDGAKACGKTMTARQVGRSEALLDTDPLVEQQMQVDPRLVLEGKTPRLLDEWQVFPRLWNHVRRAVDDRAQPGQFILTGSATPPDDETRHSGAGRFARVVMRPLTLFESGVSTGAVSLGGLFAGADATTGDPGLSLDGSIEALLRGGWPGLHGLPLQAAERANRDYIDRIARTDIHRVDGIRRDPARVAATIASLARNVATPASLRTLSDDAAAMGASVSYETVSEYLISLERLMILENQPAWNAHLRSSHRLRTTPKRHLVDPSLAAAALRATHTSLRADLNTFGLLFESMVVRDLRVYAQRLGGEVFHYRDQTGLEVDAIVDTGDQWSAFEIKLGVGQIDSAARQLLTFNERVDTSRRGAPACLGVIAGSGLGFTRPDGVRVIPIGALGP